MRDSGQLLFRIDGVKCIPRMPQHNSEMSYDRVALQVPLASLNFNLHRVRMDKRPFCRCDEQLLQLTHRPHDGT